MQPKKRKMPSSMLTKHNVEQGTEEWLLLRSKLVTASNAGKFLEGADAGHLDQAGRHRVDRFAHCACDV